MKTHLSRNSDVEQLFFQEVSQDFNWEKIPGGTNYVSII